MRNRTLVIMCLLALAAVGSACGGGQPVALNTASTPTRTPRPTFTPYPVATSTSEPSPVVPATSAPTQPPTDVPATAAPMATATNTPKPTAVKPATSPTPPPPPPSPKPSFSISYDQSYPCDQEGAFYEIIVYVKKAGVQGQRPFAPGLTFTLYDTSGKPAVDGAGKLMTAVTDDGAQSGYAYGANCQRSGSITSPDRFNGKLDVTDAVRITGGTMVFRFVDPTNNSRPISPNLTLTFPKNMARRWWVIATQQ